MRIRIGLACLLVIVGMGIGGCCTHGSWGDKHGWQCHS